MLVLDPKAAGALSGRRSCGGPLCVTAGGTAADLRTFVRARRILLLRCAGSCCMLRLGISRRVPAAFGSFGCAPPANRNLGAELPRKFRKPRRIGWRRDRT